MKTGLYISGFAHAALILWLLFGGLFLSSDDDDLLQVAEVSVLSEAEFAALSAPEPASVAPVTSPAPPQRPAAPAPEPEPQPEPEPEAAPEAPIPTPETAPADIDRVAPEAAPEPELPVQPAPEVREEVAEERAGEAEQPEAEASAPEAATTEIVTEATETADLAPATSVRPRARPNRPAPTPEPDPDPDPETQPAAADPLADAVAEAVAEATTPAPRVPVPTGPPLSQGEIRALRVSVGNCWNVGSLSTEAMQTTVVVAVEMTPDGKPEIGSIRMLSFTGGSEAAARRAYETARRAIIRCGATGYNLPSEKYERWREIEMTFNPENMRIK